MSIDEYETISFIDLKEFSKVEYATQMNVLRTTVQRIYMWAKKKLAQSQVYGKILRIEGGRFKLCDGLMVDYDHGC